MKYFSEKTKKLYDDEAKLREEEAAFDAKQAKIEAEKKALTEARKERAKEIEAAYREMQAKNKEARNAEKHYYELRNKFVKDFGSFHMTVSSTENMPVVPSDLADILNLLFF